MNRGIERVRAGGTDENISKRKKKGRDTEKKRRKTRRDEMEWRWESPGQYQDAFVSNLS